MFIFIVANEEEFVGMMNSKPYTVKTSFIIAEETHHALHMLQVKAKVQATIAQKIYSEDLAAPGDGKTQELPF